MIVNAVKIKYFPHAIRYFCAKTQCHAHPAVKEQVMNWAGWLYEQIVYALNYSEPQQILADTQEATKKEFYFQHLQPA